MCTTCCLQSYFQKQPMSDGESSSRSSSSSDNDIKLHTPKEKLEQILKRAKQILPSFKKDNLIRIYKQYYENESIFFNKLNIMASRQPRKKEEEEGWISNDHKPESKRTQRRNPVEREDEGEEKKSKYESYDFLKDVKLLKRIEENDKGENTKGGSEEYKEHREKKYMKHPEYQPHRQHEENRRTEQRKYRPRDDKDVDVPRQKETVRYTPRDEGVKYVPKEPEVNKDEPNKREKQENIKPKTKKGIKFVEKRENEQTIGDFGKVERVQKVEEDDKVQKVEKVEKVDKVEKVEKVEKVKQTKKAEDEDAKDIPVTSPPQKIQVSTPSTKATPTPIQTSPTQTPAQIQHPEARTLQQPSPTPQVKKPSTLTKPPDDHPKLGIELSLSHKGQSRMGPELSIEAQHSFQRVCRENPYILGFIKPANRVQKIEYIMDKKRFSNVKVRVITDQE